jgi:hypothetical protein
MVGKLGTRYHPETSLTYVVNALHGCSDESKSGDIRLLVT